MKRGKTPKLSHLDDSGEARMVDVGGKAVTSRRAVAMAEVQLGPESWKALTSGETPKGDALAVARLAGIQAAKKTSDLIPLCPPLSRTQVRVELKPLARRRVVRVEAEVRCEGRTGVEMEALTGASIAALTVYDMCKAVDRAIQIDGLRLLSKTGGKSGDWHA